MKYSPHQLAYFAHTRRLQQKAGTGDLKGLTEFCEEKKIALGYVITKDIADFGVLELGVTGSSTTLLKIPAPLACYWLGQSELQPPDSGV